jgi:hypothetical protein
MGMLMACFGRPALANMIATVLVAAMLLLLLSGTGLGPLGNPAWAGKGGGGGGQDRGSGPSGGPGSGSGADHAGRPDRGAERGGGPGRGRGSGPLDGDWRPDGGQALGRMIERLAGRERGNARARYEQALGAKGPNAAAGDVEVVVELTPEQTARLMRQGWARHERLDAGWRNHGERVRTMVAIAEALGYAASVGALQANFGTPFENDLEPAFTGDWSVVDLDVNDDRRVDRLDLAALGAAAGPDASVDDDAIATTRAGSRGGERQR